MFHVLVFRLVRVGGCTSVFELVVLFRASFRITCMCTQENAVRTRLFVAGLAPWEPILHLSIPRSRAQRSPNFTLNLPAADPFSPWHRGPCYLRASLLSAFSLPPQSHCRLYSLPPSSFSPTHSLRPIFTLRMLFHTLRHSHFHTYAVICNVTRIDKKKAQIYILWQKRFWE